MASFPQHDQNRGIVRAIPNRYRDIDTQLDLLSVTDEAGMARSFTVETDGDFDVVTIAVPEGQYVHGAQTYVIEYTQRDVTAFFENTGRDEFYWDINGTGWRQPFRQVVAELQVAPELVDALADDFACYQGAEGANEPCTILRTGEASYSASADRELEPRETMTIAVGFAPGTFAEAEPGFIQRNALWLTALPLAVAALLAATILILVRSVWLDAPSRRAVIAQYEPPPGLDMFLAAEMVGAQPRAAVASLLDLAVRGNSRLLHHDVPLAGSPRLATGTVLTAPGADPYTVPVFGVQAISDDGLTTAERGFAAMIFPPKLAPDAVRWFDRPDSALAERIVAWRDETSRRAMTLGLRRRPTTASYVPVLLLAILTALAQAAGLLALIERVERDPMLVAPALLGFAGTTAVVFLLILAFRRRPLTPEGREALDHLRGLQLFLRLADADRIRMLQSPQGAERYIAGNGAVAASGLIGAEPRVQIIRVYERLLPYAVLFGYERAWLATLAHHYQQARPEWMIFGRHDVHLPIFLDSLSGLVSSLATSYSGSDHSSSSGGSDDGGSAGGGGGGGGGGGV